MQEKFNKLTEARVDRTIKDLRLIRNISNSSAYVYEDDNIRKVFRALQKEFEEAKGSFGDTRNVKDEDFHL